MFVQSRLKSPLLLSPQELLHILDRVDPAATPLLAAPLLAAIAAGLSRGWDKIGNGSGGSQGAPYSGGQDSYNEAGARAFYGQKPWVVAKRLLTLASLTSTFNSKLLLDYFATPRGADGRKISPWVNEPDRAKEALVLANRMGPTFIKLGQAASIRTDLISENYALELRQLQDAVPPFDDAEARDVLRRYWPNLPCHVLLTLNSDVFAPCICYRELGVSDLGTVFKTLSSKPVASASIGQVRLWKATSSAY